MATIRLGPGDVYEVPGYLEEPLLVDAHGTPSSPAVIRPAAGRSTLRAAGNVLVLRNPRHVEVRDLDIVGTDNGDGVVVWVTESGARGVRLHGLSVSGARNGIAVGSEIPDGLVDVEISHCLVTDCLLQGILTHGPQAPGHGLRNVRITHCRVEGTRGDPALTDRHSGSGIVVGSVLGGEVADCVARGNGAGCRATEGPEGIFLYDCTDVAIRRCVAEGNRTGGPADGGGLGIDVRCADCLIEDCTATGNDGAGILLWNLPGLRSGHHIIRRNHLAGNALRTTWHGEVTVAPSISSVELSGNRLEPRPEGVAIVVGEGGSNVDDTDNLFPSEMTVHQVSIRMPGHG